MPIINNTDTPNNSTHAMPRDTKVLLNRAVIIEDKPLMSNSPVLKGHDHRPHTPLLKLLPEELFGDALTFLDVGDLYTCELLCRRVRRMILYRKLWKMHFELMVLTNSWCWPRDRHGAVNWKTLFCRYGKELHVRHSLKRNKLSGRFTWRCLNLWSHLRRTLDTHESEGFRLGTVNGESLKWKILFQRLVREGKDHLGIFLQQKDKPIRCYFSLSVLDDDGSALSTHSCPKHFQGGQELDHSTCGWLFSVDALAPVLANGRHELVVELDLTVFPNELSAVAPLFELITNPDTSEELKRVTVSSLGDFVTHYAPNPGKAKQYLQGLHGGPLPLINLLDDPKSKAQIRSAAAGALWNILDTSMITISPELVFRMVNAACLSLHNLFIDDEGYARHITEQYASKCRKAALQLEMDRTKMFEDDEELSGPRGKDLREHLVNALTGLMWNIPILNHFRKMMAGNRYFFPALFTILESEDLSRTHFTCLHLVSTLHHHNFLPPHLTENFRHHLTTYIAAKEGRDGSVSPMEVGVLLSLRDVADFFVPLLMSQKLECVFFGQWCMELFYFKTPNAA